ncbi:MAG: hypothetical protein D6718_04060 [Acidobacteria bacterium]|nr:MAG: hypothetical protein D6718_04060 [Acidobacteriota bacterium]
MGTTVLESTTDRRDTDSRTTFHDLEPRLEAVDRERLQAFASTLAAQLVAEAMDERAERVALVCGGRRIEAVPLDPRRIVRAMARHACFN